MAFEAKVLCDSLSPDKVRLTSIEVTFPRIVLAEFNTHRVFSRNSASSRAIPVAKMLQKVKDDPFIPVFWGKNQRGMQAAEELGEVEKELALEQWLNARDNAVEIVQRLQQPDIDLHKQIANRILEPWLFHTVIVTSTEWDNFWGLRCNPMAQPEIKRAAEMMREVYNAAAPSPLNYGEWHLPLMTQSEAFDLQVSGMSIEDICKISVGRCARVSYLTHAGVRDIHADIELCNRLMISGHCSPFEHVATPMTHEDFIANPFCGNFRGFVQLRKTLPNEDNFLAISSAQGGE